MTGVFHPVENYRCIGHRALDVRSVSKLSQAVAHPRRGTNITRNGISCKEWSTCYTTREEIAKEKSVLIFKELHARNDAAQRLRNPELIRLRLPNLDEKKGRPRRPSLQ